MHFQDSDLHKKLSGDLFVKVHLFSMIAWQKEKINDCQTICALGSSKLKKNSIFVMFLSLPSCSIKVRSVDLYENNQNAWSWILHVVDIQRNLHFKFLSVFGLFVSKHKTVSYDFCLMSSWNLNLLLNVNCEECLQSTDLLRS